MTKFNKKNAIAIKEMNGFRGIDRRFSGNGEGYTKELENYRILADGSLEKRGGYKPITSFDGDIRAIWTGYVMDEFVGYVIVGDQVIKLIYDENGEYKERMIVGRIGTSSGVASIFFYNECLYIVDGDELYVIKSNWVEFATGYAPLYGKEWPTGEVGEINEPINVLTQRARITYVVTDPPNIFLCTKHAVHTVQAIYVNGIRLSSDQYEIDNELKAIIVPLFNPGDIITVYLTYQSLGSDLYSLKKCNRAAVFGGINSSRVFLWTENGNRIFASRHVPQESMRATNLISTGDGALYFTAENDFIVGDGSKTIRGISRHYDRLLIFTEGETWMADSSFCDNEPVPIMRVNALSGACSEKGIARCENDPISVDNGRILRWRSNTDELDDCNAYCISEEIKEIVPESFFRDSIAFEDKIHGEVLFAQKRDIYGNVYVYGNGNWYVFRSIGIDGFYSAKKNVGFYLFGDLYEFDDSLDVDIMSNGHENFIHAYMSTYPIDFGSPYSKKRLGSLGLLAEAEGDRIKVSFESDNGIETAVLITGKDSEYVDSYAKRLNSERFLRTSMTLEGSIDKKHRIYKLAVTAKH